MTAIATCVTAFVAVWQFLLNTMPLIKKDNVLTYEGNNPIFLTRIVALGCTLEIMERDASGKGRYVDSGKSELPIHKTLYCNDIFSEIPKDVYFNGKQWPCYAKVRFDFSQGINLHHILIEVTPQQYDK